MNAFENGPINDNMSLSIVYLVNIIPKLTNTKNDHLKFTEKE